MSKASRSDAEFDVVVVGVGPAGLSAALILGRCARRVLICDDGTPRSWAANQVHGFLTRDGEGQDHFRALGRRQLRPYRNVRFRTAQVTAVLRGANGLRVKMAGAASVRTRKLLLATGVFDILPSIPGINAYFGKTALPCPYCDGWETRGKGHHGLREGHSWIRHGAGDDGVVFQSHALRQRTFETKRTSVKTAQGKWHQGADGQNCGARWLQRTTAPDCLPRRGKSANGRPIF